MKFSTSSKTFSEQPMFKILSKVQAMERNGREILHFELGEPDFATPQNIKEAAIEAIKYGDTKYAPASGIFDFKEVVRKATAHSRGFVPGLEQILVTPGANSIIYLALKCVLDPGDEVIVPDPGFPTYFSAVASLGGNVRPLKLDPNLDFGFKKETLLSLMNEKTRAIILNSPGNPTGQVLENDLIKYVYEISNENNILLISDEIYSRLTFSNSRFFSPSFFDHCLTNTLVLNGFSKAFSMTGWRLGTAIGPGHLIEKMTNLNSTIVSCVPPFIQRAGLEAITGDQTIVDDMIKQYKRRAILLSSGLNEVSGVKCRSPSGAIYVFADVRDTGLDSTSFCDLILDKCGIAATPGICFGANGEGFVRFSIVSNEENIRSVIRNLKLTFGQKSTRESSRD